MLRIDLLPGDGILGQQLAKSLEVDIGIAQQRLVAGQLSLRLFQSDLIGARIDLSQEIAAFHHLSLGEGNFGEIAAELRLARSPWPEA